MARIAFYSGSFDPLTNGHLDVIERATSLCDRLVVGIGVNPGKAGLFSTEERSALILEAAAPAMARTGCALETVIFEGLVIDAARTAGAAFIVRGLRDATDFDYEMRMAAMSAQMAPQVQTVFLPASRSCATSRRRWCARSPRWAATPRPSRRQTSRRRWPPNSRRPIAARDERRPLAERRVLRLQPWPLFRSSLRKPA